MPKTRRTPQRRCVACGTVRAKRDLVRVVRTPAGEVRVDATGKLSGRGAYVCADGGCVERALRDGRLSGALDQPISDAVAGGLRAAAKRPVDAPARAVGTAVPRVVRRVSLRDRAAGTAGDGRSEMGGSA